MTLPASRLKKKKIFNAEESLLADAPYGFIEWWNRAYGNRLLIMGESFYIPYLRVALEAWCGCMEQGKKEVTVTPTSTRKIKQSGELLINFKAKQLNPETKEKQTETDEDIPF